MVRVSSAKEYNAAISKASNALARGGQSSPDATPNSSEPNTTQEPNESNIFTGRLLYENNLRLLTETMSKKGLHTVNMGLCGEITSITRVQRGRGSLPQVTLGAHGGMGGSASFRIICHGNGTVPTFGNTDGLNDNQKNIVGIMRQDFERMCNVVDTGFKEKKKQEIVEEAMKCEVPSSMASRASKKSKNKKKKKKKKSKVAGSVDDGAAVIKTVDELLKKKLEDQTQELINRFGALPVTRSQLGEREEVVDDEAACDDEDDDDDIEHIGEPKIGRGKVKRSEISNSSRLNF